LINFGQYQTGPAKGPGRADVRQLPKLADRFLKAARLTGWRKGFELTGQVDVGLSFDVRSVMPVDCECVLDPAECPGHGILLR
jgi:hypothetical protein